MRNFTPTLYSKAKVYESLVVVLQLTPEKTGSDVNECAEASRHVRHKNVSILSTARMDSRLTEQFSVAVHRREKLCKKTLNN